MLAHGGPFTGFVLAGLFLPMVPLLNGNQGIGAAILVYAVGEVVAYTAGFGLTWFFGFSAERLEELNSEDPDGAVASAASPVSVAEEPQPTGV